MDTAPDSNLPPPCPALRHRVWLDAFQIASHPVTHGDFIAFVDDGGYRRPEPHTRELPQFLSARRALAVLGPTPRARCRVMFLRRALPARPKAERRC